MSESFSQYLVALRRHLHQHPELGMEERETSRLLTQILSEAGLTVQGGLAGGTGLYVDIEGDPDGPRVGYRADIDALPIQDAKTVPYASQNPGRAHLCGHDAHTTIAVGIALALHQQRDQLAGTVRVFFQPNEEGIPSGAPLMVRDGVLDGLDAAYAIHVDPTLEVGRFGIHTGAATAAATRFSIAVHGHGTGHSARPHEAVDTVWVATQLAQTLYQITDRLTDAREPAVLTLCRFQAGEAFNVIPETVTFGGTLRTVSLRDMDHLLDHIRRLCTHYAAVYEAHVVPDLDPGAPPVLNDGRLGSHLMHTIETTYGQKAIHLMPKPSMGTEDFAFYLQHVPGFLLRVGTASGHDTAYPLHDHRFDIDERALAPTVRLMAQTLMDHLNLNPLGLPQSSALA